MQISPEDWKNYIDKLSAIDREAARRVHSYVQKHGLDDVAALIDYSYGIATKYGEGAAALTAAMYDALAEAQGVTIPAAIPAPTPKYNEVAKTVRGTLKQSQNPNSVSNAVSRLVKRTGADTTLNNAERDGAEFAWVPSGDTCAFCIALASRGWQKMSAKARKNGHAEHIHANCDCTYAIRFDGKSSIKGYDPKKYADMYYGAEGDIPNERINSLRRIHYEHNKDQINAQKREAYAIERIKSGYNKGEVSTNFNAPGITNAEEVVNSFINSIDIPNDPIIVEKIKNSVRHMPIEDLDFIKEQGLIVKKTDYTSSFVRSRRQRGSDGKLKYVIKINRELDEPYVFAHECAHLAEKVNEIYKDKEFVGILQNLANNIQQFDIGVVNNEWYVTAISDLFIEPYQGRTYLLYSEFINGKTIMAEDLVEYISVGYECYIGDTKLLETKDPLLYNYFKRRGLR